MSGDATIRGVSCPTCETYWPIADFADAGFSAMIWNGGASNLSCRKCPEVAAAKTAQLKQWQDEALTSVLSNAEPGDIVTVHDTACAVQVGEPCDCDVLTIKVGEHQA